MLLKTLLNRYHKGSASPLFHYLPKNESETLEKCDITNKNIDFATAQPQEIIEKIHYSWLTTTYKKLNDSLKPFVLASLPKEQAEGLQRILKLPSPKNQFPRAFASLFLDIFLKQYNEKFHLPLALLPESKVNFLLNLSKKQLVDLIDFMGLHDLTEEIQHIVDKQKLRRIYLSLPPKKQAYLKICLHQKDKIASTPLGLEKWDGSRKTLENSLHRRGLIRFGKAVSGQHKDFIWHLTRKLDIGRGQILEKIITEKEIPHVTAVLIMQMTNLLKFLAKG